MKSPLELVRQFHQAFGVDEKATPGIPAEPRKQLRISLIDEEVNKELLPALEADDLVEIADGLADAVVVIYGTALEYGINLDAVLEEVCRSNMSKLGLDERPIRREDGKVLKGPNYFKPDIAGVLGL